MIADVSSKTLSSPTLTRVALAQFLGTIATCISYPYYYFGICLPMIVIYSYGGSIINQSLPDPLVELILFLPVGIWPSVLQLVILKKWIKTQQLWFTASLLATSIIALFITTGWTLFNEWVFPGSELNFESINNPMLITSLPLGLIGGLITGTVLSFWLTQGKARYILITAINWAVSMPILIIFGGLFLSIFSHPT